MVDARDHLGAKNVQLTLLEGKEGNNGQLMPEVDLVVVFEKAVCGVGGGSFCSS